IDLADGKSLGGPCAIAAVKTSTHHDSYMMFPGKRRKVIADCTETTVTLTEQTSGKRWELIFRAYDDGVAFRYRFPSQKDWSQLRIAAERTEFALPREACVYALPLNGFTTSYEKRYEKKAVTEIPSDWLLGLPLLFERPGVGWAAVTEANLTDYAGMYLARAGNGSAVLTCKLSPLPG